MLSKAFYLESGHMKIINKTFVANKKLLLIIRVDFY